MNVRRTLLPAAAIVASLGLVAGCGGSSSNNTRPLPTTPTTPAGPSLSPSVTPSAVSPTASATSTKKSGGGHACATSQLGLSLGQEQGAAGHFELPLVLTNKSSKTCTLFGYPGVSYTDSSGVQIGYPAETSGGSRHVVTLASGQSASALLSQPDPGVYPPASCQKKKTAGLRVYPPGQTASLTIGDVAQVCSTQQGRSTVSVMQKGTEPLS